jgi:hypothetical protein
LLAFCFQGRNGRLRPFGDGDLITSVRLFMIIQLKHTDAAARRRTVFILILLTPFVITMRAPDDERGVFHFPYYIRRLSSDEDRHANDKRQM